MHKRKQAVPPLRPVEHSFLTPKILTTPKPVDRECTVIYTDHEGYVTYLEERNYKAAELTCAEKKRQGYEAFIKYTSVMDQPIIDVNQALVAEGTINAHV